MEAKDLLREQFQTMHQLMDMTIADCSPEVLEKKEDGWTINKIGSLYAHSFIAEDMMVNGMGKDGTPLLMSDGWAQKLGIEKPNPYQDEHLADLTIDLEALREYATAIAQSTEDFLANATDEQLNKEIEGPNGKQPFISFFSKIGLTHIAGHWGEIAALKGVQGLKGLPF